MKKLLSLAISALLVAGLFVGCSYKTEDYKEEQLKGTLVNVTENYGGPKFTIEDDWKKLSFEFAAAPSGGVQFVYNSDVANPSDQWGNPYCSYSGALKTATPEIDIAAITETVKGLNSAVTKLDNVIIQFPSAPNSLFIKKITVTKSDDTTAEIPVPASDPNWVTYTTTVFN